MKLFWTVILSVMVGFGPALPQFASAAPLVGKKEKVRVVSDEDFNEFETNSYQVIDMGSEEQSLKVLFVNVEDRGAPEKTFRNVEKRMEEAVHQHPDLRFVNITVHPPVLETDDENTEEELGSVSYFLKRPNADYVVAKKVGTSKLGLYSYEHMQADFNHNQQTHVTNKIMEYTDERNPNLGHSVSFLKALTHTDINEMNFKRPRTDVTTAIIRAGATAFGVAFAANHGADASWANALGAAVLPATVAYWAGYKHQDLLDWEQREEASRSRQWIADKISPLTRKIKKQTVSLKRKMGFKNRQRAKRYLQEVKSFSKNSLLSLAYVATLHTSMYLADLRPEPMYFDTFAWGVAAGTFRNIYKKTLLLRGLNEWTHNKYKTNPRAAAKYARIYAWTMALIGAAVTASDSLQALDITNHPGAHTVSHWIDGTMIASGGALYIFRTRIEKAFNKTKAVCSGLFTRKGEGR